MQSHTQGEFAHHGRVNACLGGFRPAVQCFSAFNVIAVDQCTDISAVTGFCSDDLCRRGFRMTMPPLHLYVRDQAASRNLLP